MLTPMLTPRKKVELLLRWLQMENPKYCMDDIIVTSYQWKYPQASNVQVRSALYGYKGGGVLPPVVFEFVNQAIKGLVTEVPYAN